MGGWPGGVSVGWLVVCACTRVCAVLGGSGHVLASTTVLVLGYSA